MTFPDDLGDFTVKGRVVRLMSVSHPQDSSKQLYGVGIRFVNPDPKVLEAIDRAIASAQQKTI
jgi:hypothetical protein